jgi:dimeric dUTPase (all-alpha-NTP-PPase superfamily)
MALHAMECKGLVQLETLRGHAGTAYTVTTDDQTLYWPPPIAVTIARALNKQLLLGSDWDENWIEYFAWNDSHVKMKAYPLMYPYIRMLVPSDTSDRDIYRAFCAVGINSAGIDHIPSGTSAMALFMEYSLVNHMCRPNCGWEMENGSICVFAARDIEAGAELGITYIIEEFYLNVREIRRAKLRQNFGFDCRCSVCLGEEIPGSPYWLVDQQKRSLIAPWSIEMAKKVMDKGWEVLCTSRRAELTPTQAIQMLEPAQAVINRILDQRNIIVILVTRRLISMYMEVGEYEKAVKQFELVIKKNVDVITDVYGTERYTHSILCDVHFCLLQLGRMKESMPMAKRMHQLYPKVPSTDTVLDACDGLGITVNQLASKSAAGMMEEALNSGSLCLPDGVNVDNLRKHLQCSKAGKEPPKELKITDKPMFIPLIPGADGKLTQSKCGIQ